MSCDVKFFEEMFPFESPQDANIDFLTLVPPNTFPARLDFDNFPSPQIESP